MTGKVGSSTGFPLHLTSAFGLTIAIAAPHNAPAPVQLGGESERLCQLTGETDWPSGQPAAAKTFSTFGLDATDLGYPIEHDGRLILLFGDSWPTRLEPGEAPETPPDDAIGVVLRHTPPSQDEDCLGLRIQEELRGEKAFAPMRVAGPETIAQGFFNVPSGGVSVGGDLFAFFWTNHCAEPHPLEPSVNGRLGRPSPSGKCPEDDRRSSIGRSVMAQSTDDARTFQFVAPMPNGFTYSIAVDAAAEQGLPEAQQDRIYIFGAPRYRASIPCLAEAQPATLSNPTAWRFFVGRDADGQPK